MMKKEPKRLWLEALRSGERKQGTGVLHSTYGDKGRYCCLGVLCEIAVEKGLDLSVTAQPAEVVTYDGERNYPPNVVRDWSGLSMEEDDPSVVLTDALMDRVLGQAGDAGIHREATLSQLNDEGCDFELIADIIERCL